MKPGFSKAGLYAMGSCCVSMLSSGYADVIQTTVLLELHLLSLELDKIIPVPPGQCRCGGRVLHALSTSVWISIYLSLDKGRGMGHSD